MNAKIKKGCLIFTLVLAVLLGAAVLSACSDVDFSKLIITAENVYGVPEGEYTLDYTIENLDKYEEKYNLIISVKIFDADFKEIEVLNNRTFTVETDNVYSVTVYVKALVGGGYQTVFKQFDIVSENTDPKIVLKLVVEGRVADYRTIDWRYGESYPLSDMPEVPDTYPSSEGYTYTILNKYWFVLNKVEDEEALTQEHLNNITKSLTVYAHFEYVSVPKECTIIFDSLGGTQVNSITETYGASIVRPASPTKSDHIFAGWYTEPECQNVHVWLVGNSIMGASRTLYAKWIPYLGSIDESNLDFTHNTDSTTGYSYYEVATRQGAELSGNIVIPNGYNNAPVATIAQYGFKGQTYITAVTIPSTVTAILPSAFANCTSLVQVDFGNCTITRLTIGLFEGCSALTTVNVPDTVTQINGDTFAGCSSLQSLNFNPESKLNDIPVLALADTAITELVLPDPMRNRAKEWKNKDNSIIAVSYHPAKAV